MGKYVIIFSNDKEKVRIRLPINPEELEVTSTQAIESYEILKLGQIVVPTHMELKKYNFETELPNKKTYYIERPDDIQNTEDILKQLEKWRKERIPIRFMAGKASSHYSVIKDAINTPVLIESLTITEKAGEEQDKYVSFKLIEYNKYSLKQHKNSDSDSNPNNKGFYIVKPGDCLWAIAKKYYGSGLKYTKIYNANKKIIKNPSLIYPGQKLVIPT